MKYCDICEHSLHLCVIGYQVHFQLNYIYIV